MEILDQIGGWLAQAHHVYLALAVIGSTFFALQLAMIANAKRTIVVTDSNKLGKTAMYRNERKISLSS